MTKLTEAVERSKIYYIRRCGHCIGPAKVIVKYQFNSHLFCWRHFLKFIKESNFKKFIIEII
jgi:hypothetical protein